MLLETIHQQLLVGMVSRQLQLILNQPRFQEENPKLTEFMDRYSLLIVWNKGVPGKTWDGIDISSFQSLNPVLGSEWSKIRLVGSSNMLLVPSLDNKAAL